MPHEPRIKRTVAFVDGQNLFHASREAFGYTYPNFDLLKPAQSVCQSQGWKLEKTHFYTGIPDPTDNPFWHHFWSNKIAVMARQGVVVFSRSLRYRNQNATLPDGTQHTLLVGVEKGVDVRLALDVIRMALRGEYDVALIFSQDQDLSEVAEEIRDISRVQQRWIKIASAFPYSPTSRTRRGINNTDWIRITRETYDACLDPHDYRPHSKK